VIPLVQEASMAYPPLPNREEVIDTLAASLRSAQRLEMPYRRWQIRNVFPETLITGILTLPIAPPAIGYGDGTRASYNDRRTFITPALRAKFPSLDLLASALADPVIVDLFARTLEIETEGAYLRAEYIQDLDGMWLEPHRDIPEKLFSMVVYFFTGPDSAEWGTDIYDENQRWIGQAPGEFNGGIIFVPGPNTWHGFEKRRIIGVRRLMEINYVRPDWRDREQLADPATPLRRC
jgi:hypothetical protein